MYLDNNIVSNLEQCIIPASLIWEMSEENLWLMLHAVLVSQFYVQEVMITNISLKISLSLDKHVET
jgi:hypothetical protein